MKKILILGGSRYIIPVIDKIHELGHYAITCDYLPDNIAHKHSDEYHNISIIDKEKVLELAQKLKVNGIMSFACDPGVEIAAYVAEKLNLPTPPYKSVCILQNKALFREFLRENKFNVPYAKGYNNVEDAIKDSSLFNWPVIIKPVDSAGSKGVTKVTRIEELPEAAKYAIKFSKTNSFIMEEFIEKNGNSSDSDSFSVDSELIVNSFSNQYFDNNVINPYTPAAYSWPSDMELSAQEELTSELQRLIKILNLGTSIYNIETRQGLNGKTYIMEVSPRGGGNRLSELLKYATGIDLIECSVRAAIGEKIELKKTDIEYKGYWAEIILHSDREGLFDSIYINDEIKDSVIEKDLWVKEGDEIHKFTGANEAFGTLVLCFENKNDLDKVMDNISNYIKINLK